VSRGPPVSLRPTLSDAKQREAWCPMPAAGASDGARSEPWPSKVQRSIVIAEGILSHNAKSGTPQIATRAMRTSPIVLAANLSIGEALIRTEANGLWPDVDAPAAHAWIERFADLAGVSRREAKSALERRVRETSVAIRREWNAHVLWYVFDLPTMFARISGQAPHVLLIDALNLHEPDAAPTAEVNQLNPADRERFVGLLLDAGQPVALQSRPRLGIPAPSPAPRGPRSIEVSTSGEPGTGATRPEPTASASQPTRAIHAYPRIEAPLSVEAGEEFVVSVGLAAEAIAGVTGTTVHIERPAGETSFVLDVNIIADGFEAPGGWSYATRIQTDDPFTATLEVRLRALPIPGDRQLVLTSLVVIYSVGGAFCGQGVRRIVVRPAGAPLPDRLPFGEAWLDAAAPRGTIVLDGSTPPADLEIVIAKPDQNGTTGRYKITFISTHDIPLPTEPLELDLGMDAASFAKGIIDNVSVHSGTKLLERVVRGQAKSIADVLPPGFWSPIAAVADRVKTLRPGSLPSVLVITAEPHVPWELAAMSQPLDKAALPYLGVQTAMGRWLITPSGLPRPPCTRIDVHAMATMIGMYNPASGLRRLPMAEQEGETLKARYGAIRLAATEDDLLRLLDARLDADSSDAKGAEAIHIAAHGEVDPTNPGSAALFLNNRQPLTPFVFRDAPIGASHEPFIFLNACMVGTSGELLGGAGGYPNACLLAGFRALIGPLWAVNDEVAHDIALEFYRRAFGDAQASPEPVGTILADLRQRASNGTRDAFEATFLAYVFYGHPQLVLNAAWRS